MATPMSWLEPAEDMPMPPSPPTGLLRDCWLVERGGSGWPRPGCTLDNSVTVRMEVEIMVNWLIMVRVMKV